ncbi:60S ribosomal protein L27B [Sorochytrium milnesiophthora]
MKIIKAGKVVVVLNGRHAGKKAVVVKQFDEGTKQRPYPHAVVAGIRRYPLRITRAMNARRVAKRSRVKPFLKAVNYNHVMPTRYTLELDQIKTAVGADTLKEPSQRKEAKKVIRRAFEEKYKAGKNKWFFTKLRF